MAEYIDRVKCWDDFYSRILDVLFDDDTNDRANEIMDIFDELPTADVVPVRHGRWSYEDGEYCSECGYYPTYRRDLSDYPYQYCPKCGAKMDGKDGEENG